MFLTGESLIVFGRLLGVSAAAGLNLYATVAVLGLASRLGIIEALPPGLRGLEDLLLIGSAITLFLVEAVIDKVRHADSLWDTIHTFIRPPAAVLLAVTALWGAPLHLILAGALLAGSVAFVVHSAKAGLRVSLNAEPGRGRTALISTVEDVVAIALVVVALQYPAIAGPVGSVAILCIVLFAPRLIRAFLFGIRAMRARVRRFFDRSGWRELSELPADLRRLLDDTPPGTAPPRATRAAVRGVRGVGAYTSGWLVIENGRPCFLFRSMFGGRRVPLPAMKETAIHYGPWADTVEVRAEDVEFVLFLLKDGPAAELASADLGESELVPIST